MKANIACPAAFADSLDALTLDQLNALQMDLTRQRWAIKAKARAVARARALLLEHDNAAAHGLTVDEYRQVKGAVDVRSFVDRIRRARKSKRELQTAVATPATIKASAKGTGAKRK